MTFASDPIHYTLNLSAQPDGTHAGTITDRRGRIIDVHGWRRIDGGIEFFASGWLYEFVEAKAERVRG
jgi:hypothetical protein